MPTKTAPKPAAKQSGPSALNQAAWDLITSLERSTGNGTIHSLATIDALETLKAVSGWRPATPEA